MLRTRAPLTIASPFDLHVLGPPQTFALSQDQTLQFELALIMAERLVGAASTGCRCRAAVFTAGPRPDGVWTRCPRTHKRRLGFPLPLSSFQGASRGGRAVRGVGDLCSLSRLVKFFLAEIFSSPPRNADFSFGLLSESGGPGGSKGGGVYPVLCSPSSAFSRWSFRFGHREAEAPKSPKRRTRLSPISSARQDQLMRVTTARHDEPAHSP